MKRFNLGGVSRGGKSTKTAVQGLGSLMILLGGSLFSTGSMAFEQIEGWYKSACVSAEKNSSNQDEIMVRRISADSDLYEIAVVTFSFGSPDCARGSEMEAAGFKAQFHGTTTPGNSNEIVTKFESPNVYWAPMGQLKMMLNVKPEEIPNPQAAEQVATAKQYAETKRAEITKFKNEFPPAQEFLSRGAKPGENPDSLYLDFTMQSKTGVRNQTTFRKYFELDAPAWLRFPNKTLEI